MKENVVDRVYVGIDNGVTGSIGVRESNYSYYYKIPGFTQQSYTKTKANITRLDTVEFQAIIDKHKHEDMFFVIERPMVNPGRFKATVSALRCLEATLIIIEANSYPHMYCDSKEWQRVLLPQGCKKEELKKASHDIGIRLFPNLKDIIEKQKDADGILIAEWARRSGL